MVSSGSCSEDEELHDLPCSAHIQPQNITPAPDQAGLSMEIGFLFGFSLNRIDETVTDYNTKLIWSKNVF